MSFVKASQIQVSNVFGEYRRRTVRDSGGRGVGAALVAARDSGLGKANVENGKED